LVYAAVEFQSESHRNKVMKTLFADPRCSPIWAEIRSSITSGWFTAVSKFWWIYKLNMRIAYWIVTGLMAAFITLSAIPDILMVQAAVDIFGHLGLPSYLLPFIGVAKILGVIAVLIPGYPRLKEWAYAGLVFDLIGAFYSHISVGDPFGSWVFPIIALVLVFASYFLYHATRNEPLIQ
ncbi:MAG: DoxX family protein, partial [Acidobacteria bacterium]|nr:DoxX family protein [Acidobacteriota bacterium]MCA1609160.1 DoxX family protein [Acidobacteriota bacterium]